MLTRLAHAWKFARTDKIWLRGGTLSLHDAEPLSLAPVQAMLGFVIAMYVAAQAGRECHDYVHAEATARVAHATSLLMPVVPTSNLLRLTTNEHFLQ